MVVMVPRWFGLVWWCDGIETFGRDRPELMDFFFLSHSKLVEGKRVSGLADDTEVRQYGCT